jgi:hypothetical protein
MARQLLTLARIKTAQWIGECLVYTNAANRLNYFIGTESYSVANFDRYAIPVFGRSTLIICEF